MIRLHQVTQHYGVRPVLRGIDLHIKAGELVAVIGPNGMGKTTLLAVMAAVLSPQQGFVEIDGRRRRANCDDELAIRRRVVYLPDHPWLPLEMTGREFLLAVGGLYDVDFERLNSHTDRLLRLFELTKEGDWPMRSYSNGQRHKIAVCSALVTEAPVLLLDEPFSGGLDPSGIFALKGVLQGLARRSDRTVVMTTPVPEIAEPLADRVIILHNGQVQAFDTVARLCEAMPAGGSLAQALEQMIHPETEANVQRYLEEAP